MKSWKVILAVGIGIGIIYLMYYLFFVKKAKEDKEEAIINERNQRYCIENQGMVGHKACFEERDGAYWRVEYVNNIEVVNDWSPNQISKEEYEETTVNNPNW